MPLTPAPALTQEERQEQTASLAVERRLDHENRIRTLETEQALHRERLESLLDHEGRPGLVTALGDRLETKIDGYAASVNKWIDQEPSRRDHYDKQWRQGIMNISARQDIIEKKQEEDRKVGDTRHARNEQLIQRGHGIQIAVGILVAIIGFIVTVGGAIMSVLFAIIGAVWWFAHYGAGAVK